MSFRLKTILGIAIIELSVMAILIGINQFALGGSAATQLYERAEATARVFANAVADAVISTDLATLDATIESAVASEELTYLRVKSPSGVVLSQGGSSAALDAPFQRDESFEAATSDHIIDIDLAIAVEDVTFGVLELGLTTLAVENELASALRLNILVAAIGMSLVAIFSYGLGSVLTGQLHWLKEGARNVANGDLEHRIRVRGRDEIAETANCFNHMAHALAFDRCKLQMQTDELLAKKARVGVLVDAMTHISQGGEDVTVPDTSRHDEIGDMARATVVFQDTMRANELARLEQQRLISAFDQVAEQVAIFGEDGQVLFMNAAFKAFNHAIIEALPWGFTQAEFLRQGLKQQAFVNVGADQAAWLAEQLKMQSGAAFEVERAPDRILLAAQTHVAGIGTVFSAKDITERRNSQQQLIQASKMATLGEMATGMAHELNQPLGVIRMAASNSLKRIQKGSCDPTYLSGKFARIEEQTTRAAQIIDHMRIFGRKAEGKLAPFELCDAIKEVATLSRTQLQTQDITLQLQLPDAPAMVIGEKVIFEQVLLNLISNARDAIQAQGDPAKSEIKIIVEPGEEGGTHRILVQDTGGGVPDHVVDRLFEPFFTTKEPGKGTGLGLSISFGTISAMSGTINVENKDKGACFTVALPIAA